MFARLFRPAARRRGAAATGNAAAEVLEDRRLLAGDVTARLDGGRLVVNGDDANNRVVVTIAADGTAAVYGRGNTAVNGERQVGFDLGRGGNIVSRLGDGNDTLILRGAPRAADGGDLPEVGEVRLFGEQGNDRLFLRNLEVVRGGAELRGGFGPPEFNATSGVGEDVVRVADATVRGGLEIETSKGRGVVRVDRVEMVGGGAISVGLGDRGDLARLRDVTTSGRVSVGGGTLGRARIIVKRLGPTADAPGDLPTLVIGTALGENSVRVVRGEVGSARVEGGSGADKILFANVRLPVDGSAITVNADGGDDRVRVLPARNQEGAPRLALDAGPEEGDDTLILRGVFETDPEDLAGFDTLA